MNSPNLPTVNHPPVQMLQLLLAITAVLPLQGDRARSLNIPLNAHMPLKIADGARSQRANLIQTDLYFGRNIGTTDRVSERQFHQFIKEVVTPHFADGLIVYDAKGQFLDHNQTLIREPSKILSLIHSDKPEQQQAINNIAQTYQQRFQQESVLQVENQDIAVGFGQGEALINPDPTPELIHVDLYFSDTTRLLWQPCFTEVPNQSQIGCDIGTMGQVSDRQFQQFLATEVTPRFPNGLTLYNTRSPVLDGSNGSNQEPSNTLSLVIEDTQQNEQLLGQVVAAYRDQFQQESVLEVVNEAVAVGFGQGEDLIDNDPIPERIQVDLYFGRNIGTTGRVSDRQFRQFLRDEITPRFPDGLTVYDTNGQFLDRAKRLIQEQSNVVSLILEDTQTNERSLNQIIDAYKQTFQQESVLVVVDETLGI